MSVHSLPSSGGRPAPRGPVAPLAAALAALALLLAHGAAWGLRGLVQRAAPGEVYGAAVFVLPRFAPAFAFPAERAAAALAALPFLARGGDAPSSRCAAAGGSGRGP